MSAKSFQRRLFQPDTGPGDDDSLDGSIPVVDEKPVKPVRGRKKPEKEKEVGGQDRLRTLFTLLRSLRETTAKDLYATAQANGFDSSEVDEVLGQLRESGLVYEPRHGVIRFIE